MKKYATVLVFILFAGSLIAQEKYPIPVRTSDQKHFRTMSQAWVMTAAGINFARSKGTTPYEYGKYIGKLFAPSWGAGNNFDALIKGTIFNLESFRHTIDKPLVVKENNDGSVSIGVHEVTIHRFFPDGNPFASFNEFAEFMQGVNEPIADHMGATVKSEIRDSLLVFSYWKK